MNVGNVYVKFNVACFDVLQKNLPSLKKEIIVKKDNFHTF